MFSITLKKINLLHSVAIFGTFTGDTDALTEQLTCWILLHHPLKKWVSVSAATTAAAAADEIFTPAAESGETFFYLRGPHVSPLEIIGLMARAGLVLVVAPLPGRIHGANGRGARAGGC